MELATVSRPRQDGLSSVRGLELASQLRRAALEGDEARIARLLADLLRVKGLTRGQRVALQLRALVNLVHALRCAALNDEVTGLHNRRGFVQTATRLLDLAARDQKGAHLVYLRLGQLKRLTDDTDEVGPSAADVLLRQLGNFLRDLYIHRRKNLRGALASLPHADFSKEDVDAKLAELGIAGTARAETLDLEQHLRLSRVFG